MSGDDERDYDGYARLGLDRSGQAEAFDNIGVRYDDAFPHKEGQLEAGAWLGAELPPGSRILDLGCGTGLPTARQLTDAGHHVVGVDLSPGMLKLARDNVPGAEFLLGDMAELRDGRLGTFDGIAAFFALLMLPRPEIPHALRMLYGMLRPGGLLALSMVEADVDDFAIPFLGNTIRVSGYLRDELRQVVRETGFEISGESSPAYAPASTDVPPEIQLFLNLRRA
ncbi:class I SAM-dependent DNA methyltransferase [Streptomyces netropsis]|uniref:Ubiquinone/menaquinone biosynthesis C-methylase UbiE n=1 Tax=Streptomyces netropsis TaxID=55404 RepID=A0A7W7LAI2_STRNE|nr:class I SAM-dependent methyltransferase [Streptomyces netropsis]MBB4886076.1 ubiquinone/menaquinone biosynthesis C-methylase UbiE [Streptomyces netropsis]GGR16766.1 methyltransferase [Streptomyces netropsis]